MPWDSNDKYRDEDYSEVEKRKKSRRRFLIGGRRKTDNLHLKREEKK
jgi:hypothetical protein